MIWQHGEPVTGSSMTTQQSGQINNQARKDYEPLGGIVPFTKPSGGEFGVYKHYSSGGNVFAPEYGCEYDGYAMPCETKNQLTAYLDRVATAFGNRIERDAIRRSRAATATGATHTAGDRATNGAGGQMNAEQSASNSVGAQDGNADGCTYDANGNPTCAVQSERADYEPFDPEKDVFFDLLNKLSKIDTLISKRVKFIGLSSDQEKTVTIRLK